MTDYRDALRRGSPRSKACFAALLGWWGISATVLPPMVGIVGTKGKGTTAAAASFCAAVNGLRVVTVTSPHFLALRERIRVNGAPVSERVFETYSSRLLDALRDGVPTAGPDGYLSLNGRVLAMGLALARDMQADIVVVEAGIGGASDELSACPLRSVAFTEIFPEHLGYLGDSLEGIAEDKFAVRLNPTVEQAITLPQNPVVEAVRRRIARTHPIEVLADDLLCSAASTGLPSHSKNLALGVHAMVPITDPTADPTPVVDAASRCLQLVGRGTVVEQGGITVTIDSAATAPGLAARLAAAKFAGQSFDVVLAGVPTDRRNDETTSVLADENVIWCRIATRNYEFGPDTVRIEQALEDLRPGSHVLVTGVVAFAAEALRHLAPATPTSWWHTTPQG